MSSEKVWIDANGNIVRSGGPVTPPANGLNTAGLTIGNLCSAMNSARVSASLTPQHTGTTLEASSQPTMRAQMASGLRDTNIPINIPLPRSGLGSFDGDIDELTMFERARVVTTGSHTTPSPPKPNNAPESAQSGTLLKTLARMKDQLPHCRVEIEGFEARARGGWNPNPYEFMAELGKPPSHDMRKKYHDMMMVFMGLCLHTNNPNFDAQIQALNASLGKRY